MYHLNTTSVRTENQDNNDNQNQKSITIIHISDTISIEDLSKLRLPPSDILIHTGNFAEVHFYNIFQQIQKINDFMSTQNSKHKIFICGNKEEYFSYFNDEELQKKLPSCILLHEKMIEIDGINIYGLQYMNKGGYAIGDELLQEKIENIPNETNILITNAPPRSILDSEQSGLTQLAYLFDQNIKSNIKLHCFGNSSENGFKVINGVTFSNGFIADLNSPINFIHYFPPESKHPFDLLLNERKIVIKRKWTEMWKWDFTDNTLINRGTKGVLDIDKESLSNQVILWEKLSKRNNQLWDLKDNHFISRKENHLFLDVINNGVERDDQQYYDPNSLDSYQFKWKVKDVILKAIPFSLSLSQCWKYYPEFGLVQNLLSGYFLGISQFNRFVLVSP